jgi:hypothetical protein
MKNPTCTLTFNIAGASDFCSSLESLRDVAWTMFRQTGNAQFEDIHLELSNALEVIESEVQITEHSPDCGCDFCATQNF